MNVILLLFFLLSKVLFGQAEIYISNYEKEFYPNISFDFYNVNNKKIESIIKDDIFIYENGKSITDFQFSKPEENISEYNLIVFALDLSYSVDAQKIQLYISIISKFLENINLNNNRFAIVGFNDIAFNIISPTNDLGKLDNLAGLKSFGNTNYNSIVDGQFNALSYISLINERYNIIILNDGNGTIDESLILEKLTNKNVSLYSISLFSENPSEIKNIIKNKNSIYYDNMNSANSIVDNLYPIIYHSLGYRPFSISYITKACKLNNTFTIFNNLTSASKVMNFGAEEEWFTNLAITPSNIIKFGKVSLGNKKTELLGITALNSKTIINNISVSKNFRIEELFKGQSINKGDTLFFSLIYEPTNDSSYHFGIIKIYDNDCYPTNIYVSGGIYDSLNSTNTLNIVTPNGGEIINSSEYYPIKWTGCFPTDTVRLEYSINNGSTWETITNKTTGLQFLWQNIPQLNTDNALVRIKKYSNFDEFQKINSLKGINGKVIKLKWGKTKDNLYTASKDGYIRLWDINKFEPIKTIINNIVNLNFFEINYDETILAYIDYDLKSVFFHNIEYSTFIKKYTVSNNISSINFNPTDNHIVVGTDNGSIIIWDLGNEKEILNIDLSNYKVTSVKFSPNGSLLAVGFEDGNVIISDLIGNIKNQFKNSDAAITDISWNKSNSIITVSSTVEQVKVWDIFNKMNVLTINENSKPVFQVDWSPNLNFISTINSNRTINLWNPSNGILFNSFSLHTSSISALDWNEDGVRIASATDNGEVFIWSILDFPFERKILEIDTSDAFFSIKKPNYQINNIFLGQNIINKRFDTTITKLFQNKGPIQISIDSVFIKGDTKKNFELEGNFPIILNENDSISVKISFTPEKSILYKDSIVVASGHNFYISDIHGNGITPHIKISPEFITFAPTKLNQKTVPQKISIENLTGEVIQFDSVAFDTIMGFELINFSKAPLQPLEKREFEVSFVSKEVGFFNSLLFISFKNIRQLNNILISSQTIAPQISYKSKIDFENILCDNYISKQKFVYYNLGNDTLNIDSIKLEVNSNFVLDLSTSNFSLLPNDSSFLEIEFKSDEIGFKQNNILFYSNLNTDNLELHKIPILANKEKIEIKLKETSLIYYPDLEQSITQDLNFENNSSIPLFITPKINSNLFRIKNNLPILILPNNSEKIGIEFIPNKVEGIYESKFIFVDTCQNEYSVNLKSYNGKEKAKIEITSVLNFDTVNCSEKSLSKVIYLKNIGEIPLSIDEIKFQENNSFFIEKSISNTTLARNQIDSIVIYSIPNRYGLITDILRVYSNSDNNQLGYIETNVNIFNAQKELSTDSNSIKLENLYINKNYNFNLKVKNTGNVIYSLDLPIKLNNFRIDSSDKDIIEIGQEANLFITFISKSEIGIYYDTLDFLNNCSADKTIELSANVYKRASIGLRAGQIQALQGEIVDIPIYLYQIDNQNIPEVDYYTTELSFNPTILLPLDIPSEIRNKERVVKLKLNSIPDSNGIVGLFKFRTLVGNDSMTTLNLTNSEAHNLPSLVIEEQNGFLSLIGSNNEPPFIIINTSRLRLYQNIPNPVQNTTIIKFRTIEKGNHFLEFYDILGNLLFIKELANLSPDTYEYLFDLTQYSIGNYFYLLRTPSKVLIKKLTINR